MLSTLHSAWKVPELRKRSIWAMFLVAIFRIGMHIPAPGISTNVLKDLAGSGTIFGFYDLLSGGTFRQFSIFALSVTPYINTSVIVRLLIITVPSLEQLSKEGGGGRKKIQKVTKILSVVIGFILAFGTYNMVAAKDVVVGIRWTGVLVVLVTLATGSTSCIWLSDQITAKGFGNSISILVLVNIVSQLPVTLMSLFTLKDQGKITMIEILLLVVFAIVLLRVVIFFSLAERKIPAQYAGKAIGNKVMKG